MNDKQDYSWLAYEVDEPEDTRVAEAFRALIDDHETLPVRYCAALLLWRYPDERLMHLPDLGGESTLERLADRLRSELRSHVVNRKHPSEQWRLPVGVVVNWGKDNGIGAYERAERLLGPFPEIELNEVPWEILEQYRPPQIDALLAAVRKYWIDYDPENPREAPSSEDVKTWLKNAFPDLTNNQVAQVDRVARHPSAQGGGHRKKNR